MPPRKNIFIMSVERDGEKFDAPIRAFEDTPVENLRERAEHDVTEYLRTRSERESKESFSFRGDVRRFIDREIPKTIQLGAEIAVPTAATALGSAIGFGLGGPPGSLALGSLFGAGGELLSQKTGISPKNDFALLTSGLAPFLGPTVRMIGKFGAKAVARGPIARRAGSILESSNIIKDASRIAVNLLPKIEAFRLYRAVDKAGVRIDPRKLKNTANASREILDGLPKDRNVLTALEGAHPELKAVRVLADTYQSFSSKRALRMHSMSDIVRSGKLLGDLVRRLEKTSGTGISKGASKKLFSALMRDMDDIAVKSSTPLRTRRAISLWKAARESFKREMASEELQTVIEGAIKTAPVLGGETVNIGRILDRVKILTNPKHAKFDKNFTAGLGADKGKIIQFLEDANEKLAAGSLGAGELVIAARFAAMGGAVGGAIGGLVLGAPGAAAGTTMGALAGTFMPYTISRALLKPRGRKILQSLLEFSTKPMTSKGIRRWQTLSQELFQIAGRPGKLLESIREVKSVVNMPVTPELFGGLRRRPPIPGGLFQ